MTLIIIFAVLVLIGILFCIWQALIDDVWNDWRGLVGTIFIAFGGIALVVSIIAYIPSKKDSEIKYMQFIQEKASIEQMISTGENIDKLMLNKRVIEYNNKVIEVRENSKRFVFRDYYSKDVDWDSLELIEWK